MYEPFAPVQHPRPPSRQNAGAAAADALPLAQQERYAPQPSGVPPWVNQGWSAPQSSGAPPWANQGSSGWIVPRHDHLQPWSAPQSSGVHPWANPLPQGYAYGWMPPPAVPRHDHLQPWSAPQSSWYAQQPSESELELKRLEVQGSVDVQKMFDKLRKLRIHPGGVLMPVPSHINTASELLTWMRSLGIQEALACGCWNALSEPRCERLPEVFIIDVRRGVDLAQGQASVVRPSSAVTLPFESCPEVAIWEEEIVKRQVPRVVVDTDELLDPLRPLVAEIRYLHFLLFESKKVSVDSVLTMRRKRLRDQADFEVPYYPLFLAFCEGAASGQDDINFFKEVYKGGAGENIGLKAGDTYQYNEIKATFHLAAPNDPTGGIDSNKSAFAKMYKCNKKDPRPWHFGIFGERVERLWFAWFTYGDDGQPESLKVAPEFPVSKDWNRKNLLFDMAQIAKMYKTATLQDAVPSQPEPGFKLLVRFVDTLASKLGIPLAEIQLLRDDQLKEDLADVKAIGAGSKSVILRRGVEDAVFKVSEESRINREVEIHAHVDGLPCVRPMLDTGVVTGAGDGLSWLALAGYGRPLLRSDLQGNNSARLWRDGETAVYGIHSRGVFHRDVKPDNFLIFGEQLQLNDFDSSCFIDEPLPVLSQRVGTPFFESPFLETGKAFQYRDDWCSLVLSFLYITGVYQDGGEKITILRRAASQQTIPGGMSDCINWIFSKEAASGSVRE